MNKRALYRHGGIAILLLMASLKSWGNVALPQLTYLAFQDTLPAKKTEKTESTDKKQEQPVAPVIKEVPKAKKQVKPVALPPVTIPVKPPVIIKPKIVIKKIGIHV